MTINVERRTHNDIKSDEAIADAVCASVEKYGLTGAITVAMHSYMSYDNRPRQLDWERHAEARMAFAETLVRGFESDDRADRVAAVTSLLTALEPDLRER